MYIVYFENGWKSLQFAEHAFVAEQKAIECYYCWFSDSPEIAYTVQLA